VNARFLAALFEAWERARVRYVVLRNYERWPDDLGKDIDLVVHHDDLAGAAAEIAALAGRYGSHCVARHERGGHVTYRVVAADGDERALLLDVRADVGHRGFAYLPGRLVLAGRRRHAGFRVPAAGIERLALLLHCIINRREIRPSYAARLAVLPVDRDFRRVATALFGGRLAQALATAAPHQALGLRRRLVLARARRFPASATRWLGARTLGAADRVHAWIRPPGMLVVLLGPDGAGKTTVARLVCDGLARAGLRTAPVYLGSQRPLLPTRRLGQRLRRLPAGAPRPVKDVGRRLHLRGFFHILVDQWLRYAVQVRPHLVRGEIVVVDRYFYDLRTFPNPRASRPWAEAAVTRFAPRPALTFSLRADPALIAARKHELTVAETARQLGCYHALERWVDDFREVPADGDAGLLAARIRDDVVRRWAGAEPLESDASWPAHLSSHLAR
jgi:thymidylate kinase